MVNQSASGVVEQFIQRDARGVVDMKRTLKAFEEFVRAELKATEDIKPTILQELREYNRLGEGMLVAYTLHALHLPNNGENVKKIQIGIKELEAQGVIKYQTNDVGTRKGRNSGWMMVGAARTLPAPPLANVG